MDSKSPTDALRLFEEAWEDAQKAFLAAQDDFADKLANARQTLRSCAGNVEKHKGNLEQIAAAAKGHFADLRAFVESGGDAAGLEEKVQALEASLAERDAEITASKEAGNALEERVRLAEQRASDLENDLKLAKDAAEAQSAKLGDVDALRKELEAAVAAEAALVQRAESAEKDLAEARKRLAESDEEMATLEKANTPLRVEAETLRAHLAETKQKTDEAGEEIVRLRNEVARIMDELEAATAGGATAQALVSAAQDEAAAARINLEDARKAAEAAQAAAEQDRRRAELAEEKLRDEQAKGTKTSLAAQLAEAIQEAEEAKEALRALRAERGGATVNGDVVMAASEEKVAPMPSGRSAAEELKALLSAVKQAKGQKRSIGDLLVEAEIVTREQVTEAVDEQRRRPQTHLGAIFIEKGWSSEEAVAQALAYQCGASYVQLSEGSLDSAAAALISERLANQHVCIPMRATEESLTLAMANPLDLVAIEDVERSTGRKVEVMVSTGKQIRDAIGKFYWEP